jgi:hypothetical protein
MFISLCQRYWADHARYLFFVLLWLAIEVSRPLSEIADVLFDLITYQKGWEYGGSSGVDA